MATYYAYVTETNASSELVTTAGDSSYSGNIVEQDSEPNLLNANEQFMLGSETFVYFAPTTVEVSPSEFMTGFVAANTSSNVLFVFLPNFTGPIDSTPVDYSQSSGEPWDLQSNQPVCFLEGTSVQTPDGERPVEDLRAGDLVVTADGAATPVRWIGHTRISRYQPDQLSILPIRIRAGALGENLPTRDLLVSPDHAVFIDGTLVQAAALVNGCSVVREWSAPGSFTYYHIELEAHALILAEGAPVETFVDNVDRMSFDNWEEHLQRFGELESIPEMDYPRAKSARQVPSHVRRIIDRERRKFGMEVAA